MDKTLRGVRAFARCYINDIIIFSKSHAEHKLHLRGVFQRLREKGIKCHPKKLRCAVKDVSYLGHLVVPDGTAPQDVKVEAITKMVAPTDLSELRALLGIHNYYRKFIEKFARKAAPLNRLLQYNVPWEWSEPCQEAFESLKVSMTEAPILRRPNMNLPFELYTDWSAVGLGAVLIQIDNNGEEFVIAYASQSNNRTKRNYSSYYGECLCCNLGCLVLPDLPLWASVCFEDRSRTLEVAHDEREANGNARPLGKYSAGIRCGHPT
jgi:hypothetical protein